VPSFVTVEAKTPPAPAGTFGFGTSAPAESTVRYVKTSAVLEAAATAQSVSAAAATASASLIIPSLPWVEFLTGGTRHGGERIDHGRLEHDGYAAGRWPAP
jgi:hypothetical protein